MKKILIMLAATILLSAGPAHADMGAQALVDGEVTTEPICFNVVNMAPYTVVGEFATNYYTTPEGVQATHTANFRLNSHEKTNFCSAGPFFAGRQLDFTIRTLIPLFYCRTGIGGDIVIHGEQHDGGTKTWADCLK